MRYGEVIWGIPALTLLFVNPFMPSRATCRISFGKTAFSRRLFSSSALMAQHPLVYDWHQSEDHVDVSFKLPPGVTGKGLSIKIESTYLVAGIKGKVPTVMVRP
jgi:hypothetical protein